MSKQEELVECMDKMQDGMTEVAFKRDIWQNNLIWWICKSIYLLLKLEVERRFDK